jgi:hypothetical protein
MRNAARRLRAAAGALAFFVPTFGASSGAQEPPLRYSEGTFLIIVPPEYPESSLQARETGKVEVVGRVKVDGSFENPAIVADPRSPALEFAVDKVLKYWRVQPRLENCALVEAEQRVAVWFELDGDKPRVSYSQPVRPARDSAQVKALYESFGRKIVYKVPPRYPTVRYNRNTPDHVRQTAYVRVGSSGRVENVAVMPMRYYGDYQAEIVRALSLWEFEPGDKPFCAEIPIDFKLY